MIKESIAIYNPSDPLERGIQEAYHKVTNEWLDAATCQLTAKAVGNLKVFDDWLEDARLLEHRLSYLFAPHMTRNKACMVLPIHPLFVRDVLENCEISAYLYSPITLVTRPIAHYLCREYPIHLYCDTSRLKGYNTISWVDVGGLMIADEDVNFTPDMITRVVAIDPQFNHMVESIMQDISETKETPMSKAAVSEIEPGIFKIDSHERGIEPGRLVWDKKHRQHGFVSEVEPGETGQVSVTYEDGREVVVPKLEFDRQYITH